LPLVPGAADGLSGGPQTPADNTAGSQFGFSTGIDSLWAIGGAPSQNSSIGAAYIYQNINGDWMEMAKLQPDDATPQLFGASVSIDYPYAVVGAPGHNTYSGCVYVFFHNGSSWVQVNKFFKPVNNVPLNYFGNSVDISGSHMVVGCPGADDVVSNGGAVYTYRFNGSSWAFQNTLSSVGVLQNNAAFGTSVAVAGLNIVAGVPGQQVSAELTGLAWFYLFTAGNWTTKGGFAPTQMPLSFVVKDFGAAVDIHYQPGSFYDVTVAVGAPGSFHNFTNVPDVQNIGACYVYWGNQSGFDVENVKSTGTEVYSDFTESENYKYGAAVAVSHTGTADNSYPGTVINLNTGSPGRNNNKGGIYQYTIKSAFDLASGFANGTFSIKENGIVNGSGGNNKLGTAVDMFSKNTSIAGGPGSNNNKGSVIFDY
jgi:hypothetical protein